MKTEIHDFPGRLVIFLTSRVTGTNIYLINIFKKSFCENISCYVKIIFSF